LQDLGRIEGRNIRLDIRLAGDDLGRIRAHAAELAHISPAAILAIGTPVLVALREVTRTIPIVFANVSDPVDGGFVDSEARPGFCRPHAKREQAGRRDWYLSPGGPPVHRQAGRSAAQFRSEGRSCHREYPPT